MNPTKPIELYKKLAESQNLPEEYIRDVVEYFYTQNRERMHLFSHVVFTITGLGRFVIRPLKFWKRKSILKGLLDNFSARRDDRGIMIRKELETRYKNMQDIEEDVNNLNERKYGIRKDLEK